MAQTQKKQQDMGTGDVKKLLLQLMIPAVVAQVVNLLYNIVDRIYIGHIPEVGDLALTGVGVTFPIITLVSAFAAFAGQGGAPLAAISYDPKVTGFMHYIGQKHCVYFEDVTAENLCALIDGALGDTGSYSVDRLRTLAAQNEEIAKKLLEEDR